MPGSIDKRSSTRVQGKLAEAEEENEPPDPGERRRNESRFRNYRLVTAAATRYFIVVTFAESRWS